MDTPDQELVARTLTGDQAAFAILVGRYAAALHALAFVRVRNSEDARDLVQQTLFSAYVNLSALKDPGRFGPWLKAIVLNQAKKTLENRSRRQRMQDRLVQPEVTPHLSCEVIANERAAAISSALEGLNESRREVIALYYFDGIRVGGVANLTGRTPGSIKRMLYEARNLLKKELIDMAREEFTSFYLSDGYQQRFSRIAAFPVVEPAIRVTQTSEKATETRTLSPFGSFTEIREGAESSFAEYDHPGARLTSVVQVTAGSQVVVDEKLAIPLDHLVFGEDGRVNWIWRPYIRIEGDEYWHWAAQFGNPKHDLPLVIPGHPQWLDPADRRPTSFLLVPGTCQEPDGEHRGMVVDETLHEVQVGRNRFECVRRVSGGQKVPLDWSDEPVTTDATEEFILPDGRLLLWRRYNGLRWSERNPEKRYRNARGVYERLRTAGMPAMEIFGETYYLWYDQIPDYALTPERVAATAT